MPEIRKASELEAEIESYEGITYHFIQTRPQF